MVAFPVFGDSKDLEDLSNKQCGELSVYNQIAGCYHDLYIKSDELLNNEYQELMDYLSGADKENLIAAQRKWIEFRDAECFFSDPRGEENLISFANKYMCLFVITNERLKHLEEYNWSKGCNGCPW
jgi:uncharacterized protein YecT (DUF1311 family)